MSYLKKMLVLLTLSAVLITSACNTKKDCRGRTKHKLPNGIWM
jgi:protein involved in sex pheromone biosynthesis